MTISEEKLDKHLEDVLANMEMEIKMPRADFTGTGVATTKPNGEISSLEAHNHALCSACEDASHALARLEEIGNALFGPQLTAYDNSTNIPGQMATPPQTVRTKLEVISSSLDRLHTTIHKIHKEINRFERL